MKLKLRVDSLLVVNLWIHSSYDTHDDCRGHTRSIMSLVKGPVLSLSLKQKSNVKISTKW